MLDFQAVRDKKMTYAELAEGLTVADLRNLTNEMIDTILGMIADCTDADVVFEPDDPEAKDTFAIDPDEEDLAWNLGHLVAHVTASSEEAAALASELARGVELHGRSRSEIPWRDMTTIAQCRQRLEESRRMRLASLDMWPDEPYLDLTAETFAGEVNAVGRFILGLSHASSHIDQFADVVQQAKAARGA